MTQYHPWLLRRSFQWKLLPKNFQEWQFPKLKNLSQLMNQFLKKWKSTRAEKLVYSTTRTWKTQIEYTNYPAKMKDQHFLTARLRLPKRTMQLMTRLKTFTVSAGTCFSLKAWRKSNSRSSSRTPRSSPSTPKTRWLFSSSSLLSFQRFKTTEYILQVYCKSANFPCRCRTKMRRKLQTRF